MPGYVKVARTNEVTPGQAKMVEVEGKQVTCPWHGATYDVTTGGVLGPPAPKGVARYNVRVKASDIEVEI